jgi:hypothetical protein
MSKEDWRSASAYEYAAALDAAGLAWEFLRRNPDYQNAYSADTAAGDRTSSDTAHDWGLRIPGRSDPAR